MLEESSSGIYSSIFNIVSGSFYIPGVVELLSGRVIFEVAVKLDGAGSGFTGTTG